MYRLLPKFYLLPLTCCLLGQATLAIASEIPVFVFDDVAAMRASVDLRHEDRVKTLGYHEKGDGGANTYVVIKGDAASADEGSLLYLPKIDALAMSLHATVPKHQSAQHWGFSADSDGLKNAGALQAAIDYVCSRGGGRVQINGTGTYPVEGDIYLGSNVELVGMGYATWIAFKNGGLKFDAIRNQKQGARLENFGVSDIQLSRSGTDGAVIEFLGNGVTPGNVGVAHGVLSRVWISASSGEGILASDAYIHDWYSLDITGCAVGIKGHQIGDVGTNLIRVHGGSIKRNTVNLHLSGAKGWTFFGTEISGSESNGVIIDNNALEANNLISFYGCRFENNGTESTDYDVVIGDDDSNSNYLITFDGGCKFAQQTAVVKKRYAIHARKVKNLNVRTSVFSSSYQAAIHFDPYSGDSVTGTYGNLFLDGTQAISEENHYLHDADPLQRFIRVQEDIDLENLVHGEHHRFRLSVAGVQRGDFVQVSFGRNTRGLTVSSDVCATGSVCIAVVNHTGDDIDLDATTVHAVVMPKAILPGL